MVSIGSNPSRFAFNLSKIQLDYISFLQLPIIYHVLVMYLECTGSVIEIESPMSYMWL